MTPVIKDTQAELERQAVRATFRTFVQEQVRQAIRATFIAILEEEAECVKTLWTDSGTLFWCIRCAHSAGRLLPRLAGHIPGVKGPLRRLRPLTPGLRPAGGLVSPAWPQHCWGGAG